MCCRKEMGEDVELTLSGIRILLNLPHLLQTPHIHPHPLPLCLWPERITERLRLDNMHPPTIPRLPLRLQQPHRQLVPPQQDRERVLDLVAKAGAEVIERRLGDDSSVAEPATVRLDATHLVAHFLLGLLKRGGLDDLAVPVADGFAAVEHFDARGGFGIAVEVFAWRPQSHEKSAYGRQVDVARGRRGEAGNLTYP